MRPIACRDSFFSLSLSALSVRCTQTGQTGIAIGWPTGSLTTERSAVITPHRALVVMSYISHM